MPVVYATPSVASVAALVVSAWGVDVAGCRFLRRGFNDVFAIEAADGRALVLRISGTRSRGPADVAEEAAFLDHLHAAGVPVSTALRTPSGACSADAMVPGAMRAAMLFHAAPGRTPGLDSPEDAAAQGRTLAALHDAATTYRGASLAPLDADRLLHRPLRLLRDRCPDAALDAIEAVQGRLAERWPMRAAALGTPIRLHGDCHGLNARIAAGRATFFDFDDGGLGWPAYDLAVFLWAQVSFGRARWPMWHAFMAAYAAARPLHPAERAAIPLFVALRHLWLMGEFADQSIRWGDEALPPDWITREATWLAAWERDQLGPTLFDAG